jgi:hypothetical protein
MTSTNASQEQLNVPCLNISEPILNPENKMTGNNENNHEYDSNDEYSDDGSYDYSDDGFDTYIASNIDGHIQVLRFSSDIFYCIATNMYGKGCKEILLFKGSFQDQPTTILYDENVKIITITRPDGYCVYESTHFKEFCEIYQTFETDNNEWSNFFANFSNEYNPISLK